MYHCSLPSRVKPKGNEPAEVLIRIFGKALLEHDQESSESYLTGLVRGSIFLEIRLKRIKTFRNRFIHFFHNLCYTVSAIVYRPQIHKIIINVNFEHFVCIGLHNIKKLVADDLNFIIGFVILRISDIWDCKSNNTDCMSIIRIKLIRPSNIPTLLVTKLFKIFQTKKRLVWIIKWYI